MAANETLGASAISITIESTQAETETKTQETTTTVVQSVVGFLADQIDIFLEQTHISLEQLLHVTHDVISRPESPDERAMAAEQGQYTEAEIGALLRDDLTLMIERGLLSALHLFICDPESDATGAYRVYYSIVYRVLPNDPHQLIRLDGARTPPSLINITDRLAIGSRAVLMLEWNAAVGAEALAAIRGQLRIAWSRSSHIYELSSLRLDQEHQEQVDGTKLVVASVNGPHERD
ncbi:MAG TPA: hypothetical protein VGF38_08190 [Ktedonobacterales bacterium]|jgi:hypothetical protein